ncbi:hypothetical protein EYF80_025895 [Liparis tanakae]|uniref:Uncharacterized protein n=1 Tax=Liparis tanakae TaxID=230148 RepID=A0A4Z2HE67_9TELE|nr:hypothetical protein EYF80_025895 [Liparis tanakae]
MWVSSKQDDFADEEHSLGSDVDDAIGINVKSNLNLWNTASVPVDEFGEHPAQGLNTQRQRCHIQQQHISDITSQNTTLDGCSYGNSLIRRSYCDKYLGHTAHSSNQQHLAYVSLGHLGILHGLLTGSHSASDQVTHNAFKLSTSQLYVEMFGT